MHADAQVSTVDTLTIPSCSLASTVLVFALPRMPWTSSIIAMLRYHRQQRRLSSRRRSRSSAIRWMIPRCCRSIRTLGQVRLSNINNMYSQSESLLLLKCITYIIIVITINIFTTIIFYNYTVAN